MNDAGVLITTDRVDRHHHELQGRSRSKITHVLSPVTGVDGVVHVDLRVQVAEVLSHQLDAGLHALTDRNRGNQDDVLVELILRGQLKGRAQVDISLTRAGLHLDIELQPINQLFVDLQAVPVLHALQVLQNRVLVEDKIVAVCADL